MNKYQEDFDLVTKLSSLNGREITILNYGVEQGKIESGKDFEKLLKAMQETYPKSKAEYVDFDVFVKEVMKKFADIG
jgi:hypothetical protein